MGIAQGKGQVRKVEEINIQAGDNLKSAVKSISTMTRQTDKLHKRAV